MAVLLAQHSIRRRENGRDEEERAQHLAAECILCLNSVCYHVIAWQGKHDVQTGMNRVK